MQIYSLAFGVLYRSPRIVKSPLNKGAAVHDAGFMGLTALHHALLPACEPGQGYPWKKMKGKILFHSKGA
jgi:hypothetical protein